MCESVCYGSRCRSVLFSVGDFKIFLFEGIIEKNLSKCDLNIIYIRSMNEMWGRANRPCVRPVEIRILVFFFLTSSPVGLNVQSLRNDWPSPLIGRATQGRRDRDLQPLVHSSNTGGSPGGHNSCS